MAKINAGTGTQADAPHGRDYGQGDGPAGGLVSNRSFPTSPGSGTEVPDASTKAATDASISQAEAAAADAEFARESPGASAMK